jgi:hypothetical protein
MPMRFDHIEIDDDDIENWDIGYVNTMEAVQRYIDKYIKEGITFQTDRVIEDAKYAQEHFMVMKRKENTSTMMKMYDVTTDTWYVQEGKCPYCEIQLYSNEGLNDSNSFIVRCHDNQIIKLCKDCIRYMSLSREIVQVKISDYSYIYEFVNSKEKKKKRS